MADERHRSFDAGVSPEQLRSNGSNSLKNSMIKTAAIPHSKTSYKLEDFEGEEDDENIIERIKQQSIIEGISNFE